MRCREATGLLSADLDAELAPGAAARVQHHLAGCARCRQEREIYETIRTQFRVAEPVAVDLVPALRDRLAGEPAPALGTLERAPARPRRGRAVVATACALAAAVAAVAFVGRSERNVSVSTSKPVVVPRLAAPGNASLLLAWTSNGLPAQALDATRAIVGVVEVTEVRGAELRLTAEHDARGDSKLALPAGAAIPIDALAIDPVGYARDVSTDVAAKVRKLPRDGALLGATSARLRGIGVGGSLTFGSTTVHVTGVVADSLVGAAEVVVPDDSPLAIPTPRFLLVAYHGDRSELEGAIVSVLRRPVRFRAPSEVPYLRQGDAVLPQALVKARFGEFWYRVDGAGNVTIDPRWVARNIVTIAVPGVGRLEINRLLAPSLRSALARIAPGAAKGASVFAPQLISPGLGLSRHTWGIGLTLDDQRPQTIASLAAAGFTWGGLWLDHSPNYYEWVGAGGD